MIEKKVYNCTLCQVTVSGDDLGLHHLNRKWDRNTLKRSAKVEVNKIVNSDIDNTGTPDIGFAAMQMEMDIFCDSLATKPAWEQLQTDEGTINKMQVIEIFRT
jgi:hypothetical protein